MKVTDGDSLTVSVGGEQIRVRLMGINAPETDECFGSQSTASLAEMVTGRPVRLVTLDLDQYGRTLAYLVTPEGVANLAQVERGMAIVFSDAGPLAGQLFQAETRAQIAGLGWWERGACGDRPIEGVTIHLVQPDPPGPDDENLAEEMVEIRSRERIDLSGFVVRDESTVHRLIIPAGTIVGPESPLSIRSGCGDGGLRFCADTAIWNNRGDAAILLSPNGSIVAIDRYLPD